MARNDDEDDLLRSVALQNAKSILQARQRAEEELVRAKEALELKTAELARSLAMVRATLESTTDGILVTDGTGQVTGSNQKYLEMWRLPRDIMDSNEHRNLLDACSRQFDDPRQYLAGIDAIFASSPPETFDLLELTDGRVFERFSRIQVVEDRNVGRVWSFRDITERKLAEQSLQKQSERLREADRQKDDFLALLAHELRNPLAPLRNGLQVMRLANGDADAVDQARAMMDRQLGHMVRLIDDLLDASRIGRNKMELRRSPVLLSEIIDNAVETARPAIEAAGHGLGISLPAGPVFLDADLTRLAQVLSNLLTNSAKYTDRAGQIWLTAERSGDDAVITVRDNGTGITADALPRVFDMFSQAGRSLERTSGGLGIGLALVKGLVEMHGGTVAASSDGPGTGSTFTVRLPALPSISGEPDSTAAPPQDARPHTGSRRRILVVDDSRASARTLATVLQLLGNEVNTAHDGIEALEAAEKFLPEVILMDVGMPRLNGYDAARRIREQPWGRSAIIIALTGWGRDGDRIQSKEAGCNAHLVKPVNLPDLQKLLSELTAAHESEPHAQSFDGPADSISRSGFILTPD
jgi:signal transduction histidine kinase/ActR/RegA family two-component response regulator